MPATIIKFVINLNLSTSDMMTMENFPHSLECILHCFDVRHNQIETFIKFESNNFDVSLQCQWHNYHLHFHTLIF